MIGPVRENERRLLAPLTEHGLDATGRAWPAAVASVRGIAKGILELWRAGVR
jgi:hypothetical protein